MNREQTFAQLSAQKAFRENRQSYRKERESVGLTQEQMARILGVSPATVSRWESGAREPGGKSSLAYIKTLNQAIEYVGSD